MFRTGECAETQVRFENRRVDCLVMYAAVCLWVIAGLNSLLSSGDKGLLSSAVILILVNVFSCGWLGYQRVPPLVVAGVLVALNAWVGFNLL